MLSTAWLWSPPSVAPTSPAPRPACPRFLVGDVPSCYIMFHHVPRYANLPTSFGLWANATPWPCWFFSPSVRFWNLLLLSSRTLWLLPPYCKTLTYPSDPHQVTCTSLGSGLLPPLLHPLSLPCGLCTSTQCSLAGSSWKLIQQSLLLKHGRQVSPYLWPLAQAATCFQRDLEWGMREGIL